MKSRAAIHQVLQSHLSFLPEFSIAKVKDKDSRILMLVNLKLEAKIFSMFHAIELPHLQSEKSRKAFV
jgi:hypothetical protein